MKLTEIIETNEYIKQYGTDKESIHKYCSLIYQEIFEPAKDKKMDILEIGIQSGASLVLWNEFFKNSIIYGIDNANFVKGHFDQYPRIKTIIQNAYNEKILTHLPLFDIIIDDGPHSLESQKKFISLYFNKLKKGGILIIEDIDGHENANELIRCAYHYSSSFHLIDTRKETNRHDNIVLIINNDHESDYLK
jgi:hypothetical protein